MMTKLELKDKLKPIFARPFSEENGREVAEIMRAAAASGFSALDLADIATEALSEARPAEAIAFTLNRGGTPKEVMRRELGFD